MDITRIIAYIEENLTDSELVSISALARYAGYSEFHFIRLFRSEVGLNPADYIRKRRISEIVMKADSSRPISDIAFEYGFNSKENFTRAFRKEHGILPSEYRKAGCSLRLYAPHEADPAFPKPDVSLLHLDSFEAVVYPFGDMFPPHAWNRYNSEKRSQKLAGKLTEDFGIMYRNEEGKLIYSIGIRASEAVGDTAQCERITVSGGLYAVFVTHPSDRHSFTTVIRRTWDWIYSDWLPSSGYIRAPGYEMESYAEHGRTYSEKIYVPIQRKGE